mgnify:CR=1 FL=1
MTPTAQTSSDRPRRSALYMPASNAKAVAKARTLPADVIILDLEDAVAPEMKADARAAAIAAVAEGGFGRREVAIRANGLDTPWGADDLAAIAKRLDGRQHRRRVASLVAQDRGQCHREFGYRPGPGQVAEVDESVGPSVRITDHVVIGDIAVDHLNGQVLGDVGDHPPGLGCGRFHPLAPRRRHRKADDHFNRHGQPQRD